MEIKSSRKRKFTIIVLISLAALIPRIAVSLNVNATAWPDSWAYISIANSLASGHGYSFETPAGKNPEYRAPLYPLFLATVFKFTGNNIFFVQLFQSLFGVITCLLVYGVGRRLFNEEAGLLAAILACVYPFLVYISSILVTEQLFVLFLLLSIYLLIRGREHLRYVFIIAAGISLGLGALTRPSMLAVVPFCGLYLFFRPGCNKGRCLAAVALLFVSTLLTISPWTIRNYIKHGEFILISTAGGENFWLGNNDMAKGNDSTAQLAGLPEEILSQLSESSSPKTVEKVYWRAGIDWVIKNPERFLRLYIEKLVNFWRITPDHITNIYRQKLIRYGCAAILVPLYLFSIMGIVYNCHRYRDHMILYFTLLSFPLGLSLFVTSFRFRIPLDPILLLFTASFICRILSKERKLLPHKFSSHI